MRSFLSLVLSGLLALAAAEVPDLRASSAGSTQYIHSNDTIRLYLDPTAQNVLHGAPGSVHQLAFVVENNYKGGRFSFE